MVLGRQQQRRDTAANWSSNNPTLAAGEIGLDTTNTLVKVGDGSTAWNSLSSFGVIELGHVSDTTLSRASAGVLAVEGVNVLLNGGALGTPSSGTATNLTGFPTLNQSTTGNAATATALATARTINGVSFNGTGNIVITKRQVSPSSSATPSVNIDTADIVTITATANITSMSSGLSGTPYHGQHIMWEFTGSSAFTIVWGASFGSSGVATLLAATVASKVHRVFTVYDSTVSNAAAVANTVTMPSHSTGNLILASVWRTGSTTTPTIPGGWTLVKTQTGTTSWMGVYYKIAASSSETTGTWTSATAVEVNVYSGASGVGTGSTGGTGTGTTITYPAVTLQKTNSTSWVYRTACAKAATNITTNTPTGYTARGGVATTGSAIRGCDSNAGLASSPSTGTQTVSGSGVWIALSVEILQIVPPGSKISTLVDDFSSADGAKWDYTSAGAGASVSGGQLTCSSFTPLMTVASYDFVGSAAFIQVVSAGSGFDFGSDYFTFSYSSPTLSYSTSDASVSGSVTYSATTHKWLRFRESSGTVFFEASPDGSSWSTLTGGTGSYAVGTNGFISIDGSSTVYDNFNNAPSATNTGAFFAMF